MDPTQDASGVDFMSYCPRPKSRVPEGRKSLGHQHCQHLGLVSGCIGRPPAVTNGSLPAVGLVAFVAVSASPLKEGGGRVELAGLS